MNVYDDTGRWTQEEQERDGYLSVELSNADLRKLADAGANLVVKAQGVVQFAVPGALEHPRALGVAAQIGHVPGLRA